MNIPNSLGDAAQVRVISEQVAEAVITKFVSDHPLKADVPAPLKWAAAVVAALFTAGSAALVFWLVSTVSQMQVTLARMDERMASGAIKDSRFEELDRRVSALEGSVRGSAK